MRARRHTVKVTRRDFDFYRVRFTDRFGAHEELYDWAWQAMSRFDELERNPLVWAIFWTTSRGYVFAKARLPQGELPLQVS
jgi:MoxR-like ATPase